MRWRSIGKIRRRREEQDVLHSKNPKGRIMGRMKRRNLKREKVRGAAAHRGGRGAWEDGGDIINRARRV